MRQEELGTYEMLWDCTRCGTPKLLGIQHRHCPACGGPQDPDARYFPPEEEKIAVEDHMYQGADRVCSACTTANAGLAKFCVGCGSPLDGDAKEANARGDQQVETGQGFAAETAADALAESRARRAASRAEQTQAPKPAGMSRGLKIGLIVGGIALVIVVAISVLFFWKREATVTVKGHAWARSVEIEVFDEVKDSAWCDDKPRGARRVTKKQEKRSTKQIPDGETCVKKRKDNRDGTFKEVKECKPKYRDEPVYADKCYFYVDKWVTKRTPEASASDKISEPKWPEVELKKAGTCKGCEREGQRHETYTLHFVDEAGERYECGVERTLWDQAEIGSKWKAEVGVVTTSLDCDSFSPAP